MLDDQGEFFKEVWQKGNAWSCSNQKEFNDFQMFPGIGVVSLARLSSLFLGITHPITITHPFPKQNYRSCRNIHSFSCFLSEKNINPRTTPMQKIFVLTNIKDEVHF